jgi:peptidoglycan biosynthesis protein MviN/MurJ (putative lipid II flippase)
MFIAMCAVCTVLFDLSFAAELWLRKRGRLAPNRSTGEKVLMGMTILFAIVGTCGLILLAIFDTWRHNTLHNIFLLLFIGGYWISAIFVCAEYQRLGISMRSPNISHPRLSLAEL